MYLEAFNSDVIDVEVIYDKFPKGDLIVAFLDEANLYYEDELNINDWFVIGIGENSPGTYYVMDMFKKFVNKKDGKIMSFDDHNISTGGETFSVCDLISNQCFSVKE